MSTQEQRERFEAAQRPRTDLAKNRKGDYTNPVVQHCWRTWQAAEAAAIERCARWCDEYAADRWSLYKGRAPYKGNEEGRANPLIEGESDGASACAEGLRSLLKHDY